MQPQPGAPAFSFFSPGLPEDVEYYVEAGALRSRHFNIRVVDLPAVKQIRVTYRYPCLDRLADIGRRARRRSSRRRRHRGGARSHDGSSAARRHLVLDDDQQIQLSGGAGQCLQGHDPHGKGRRYHVAALDQGSRCASPRISSSRRTRPNPPEVAIARPGARLSRQPHRRSHRRRQSGRRFRPERIRAALFGERRPRADRQSAEAKGAKTADGSTVLSLENFKMVPGDIVSVYATAKDAQAESRTDMFFIQADPFEREFSQSQQMPAEAAAAAAAGRRSGRHLPARKGNHRRHLETAERQDGHRAESGRQRQVSLGGAVQAARSGSFSCRPPADRAN